MPEISLNRPEDIEKIQGWMIKEAKVNTKIGSLELELSHPLAGKDIKFMLTPMGHVKVEGVKIIITASIFTMISDIEKREKKGI